MTLADVKLQEIAPAPCEGRVRDTRRSVLMQEQGYCKCGCGERTNVAPQAIKKHGLKKGEHYRFVHGHNGVASTDKYRIDPLTDCWVWQRFLTPDGYGRFVRDGVAACTISNVRAERFWKEKDRP